MRYSAQPVQVQRVALGDVIMADEGPAEVTLKEQHPGVNAPVLLEYVPRRTGRTVGQVYPHGDEEVGLLVASPMRPDLDRVAS